MPRANAPCAKPRIAVLGASGSLGGEACALAAQLLDADMLIAGRNREALEKVSAALPRPAAVVTADLHSLSGEAVEAFSTCDVLLNCTGPSWKNAVAAASLALKTKGHYVDPGGYAPAMAVLEPHHGAFVREGRSCMIGAGWMPGLSELAARYLLLEAAERFGESVREVDVFFGARDRWPRSSVSDMIWHLFELPHSLGWFERGEWKKATPWNMGATVDLAPFGGKERVSWAYNAPFAHMSREYPELRIRAGLMFVGAATQATIGGIRLFLRNRRDVAEHLLQRAIARDAEKHGTIGLVVGRARTCSNRELSFAVRAEDNMRVTALTAVLAARHALNRSAAPGVAYFDRMVPPRAFFADVESAGVRVSGVATPEDESLYASMAIRLFHETAST